MNVKIENVPSYAKEHKFIVARVDDGLLWFWGAFDEECRAKEVADEVDGVVVENMEGCE